MRIIMDPAKYELLSIMRGIRTYPESWENWYCLQIEMPELSNRELYRLHANVGLLLTTILPETGNTFFSGRNEILVFCKNISETLLYELGQQIQNLAYAENSRGTNFTTFDVRRDADHLTSSYSWQKINGLDSAVPVTAILQAHLPEPETANQGFGAGNRKVLLVEDDPVTRWLVRTALKDQCLLATAPDAGKALAAYSTYKPDMVLLDINLPDGNGYDVMAALKKADPGAWVVMFSSQDSLENISNALGSGAKGFIAKPFSREKVLHYVKECPAGR